MQGSVLGLGNSFAAMMSQLGPQQAARGDNRVAESHLMQQAAASTSKLPDNSGGRSEIANG